MKRGAQMLDNAKVIAIIDVETTGISIDSDQIIEFAVQKGLTSDGFKKTWRFKPTIPVPLEATKVHGITNQDLEFCPPFSTAIPIVRRIIERSNVIVGYNIRFDLAILQAEFSRAGAPILDIREKCIVDPYELWIRNEPRKLTDAMVRFAKREHENAHSALADVQATGEVLLGMIDSFGLQDCSWDDLCNPEQRAFICGTSHMKWKEDNIVFGFGKHRDKEVLPTIKKNQSYADWICKSDFPVHVKKIVSSAATMELEAFLSFVRSEYGSP